MDLSTIIGIVGGAALIVIAMMQGGDVTNFWDLTSVLIVIGGTLFAVIASFPFGMLKNVFSHGPKLLSGKKFRAEPIIEELVEFAQVARKNGLLALEEKSKDVNDVFLQQGIMLIVDAMEPDKVREMLEAKVENMYNRHEEEIGIYDKAAAFSPAFGMVGTLVGLINMLKNMNLDAGGSSNIGQDMSVALITTLYGSVLANLIFMPLAKKLRVRNEEEVLYKQIIIEGIVGIQAGENPKLLKEKLTSFLREKQQLKLLNGEDSGGGKKGGRDKGSKKKGK